MNQYLTNIKTSPTQRAVITAITLIALNGLLYVPPIYGMVGAHTVLWINNSFNIAAALVSVWLGFRLWRSFHHKEILGMIWGSLTSGLILWTIADLIWGSEQLLSEMKLTHFSLANIAWILGYFAVIVGLILRLHTIRIHPTKRWQFTVLAAFCVLVILVIIYVIVPTINSAKIGLSYEKFFSVFYPVGDLILAFLALLLVLVLEGGMLSKPWMAIALACFFIAISDLLYAFAISQGIYHLNPIDRLDFLSSAINLSYTFSYLLMALGLYLQARLQDAI